METVTAAAVVVVAVGCWRDDSLLPSVFFCNFDVLIWIDLRKKIISFGSENSSSNLGQNILFDIAIFF